ncbi:MAG: invasion associated locus B family protein [Candidatus Competibacterales bacterium]
MLALISGATQALENGQQFGDWAVRCEALGPNTAPTCTLVQTLVDSDSRRSVMQMVTGYFDRGQPAALIAVPLNVALTRGVAVAVEGLEPRLVSYSHCTATGCVAGLALDDALIQAFRRQSQGRVAFWDLSGQAIELGISLEGFAAGFAALAEGASPGTAAPRDPAVGTVNGTQGQSQGPVAAEAVDGAVAEEEAETERRPVWRREWGDR